MVWVYAAPNPHNDWLSVEFRNSYEGGDKVIAYHLLAGSDGSAEHELEAESSMPPKRYQKLNTSGAKAVFP